MAEKKDNRKFEVVFTAMADAQGEPRSKGEVLTTAEVGDVERQLSVGAIIEVKDAQAAEEVKE